MMGMSELEIPDADGVWTMTDAEFKRELASAWDECLTSDTPWINPYRSKA